MYEVILWNWTTAEVVGQIPCDESPAAISFSPDGKLLAVEEGYPADHSVKIWNIATMLK
jgi:WD40 repeat protein